MEDKLFRTLDFGFMELEDLLADSSRKTVDIAVSFIGENPDLFKKMLDFALLDKYPYAMRAARVIQVISEANPNKVIPYIDTIVHAMPHFKTGGLNRSMLRILSYHCKKMSEEQLGILTDVCFKNLLNSNEKPAIKVYSLDILYEISNLYPDIKPELISSIETQLPRSSIGIKSKSRKMLKKLRLEIKK